MVNLGPKLTLLVIQILFYLVDLSILMTLEELVGDISKASMHFDAESKIIKKVNPLYSPKKSYV